MNLVSIYPTISDEILLNPGIGFIAAPGLKNSEREIVDNRGNVVAPFQFTEDSATFNHPDSKVSFSSVRWRDIEQTKGVYDFSPLIEKLAAAEKSGCLSIVRCSPYALGEDDVPGWFREECPEEPDFPFWKVDPNLTPYAQYWSLFVKAFAKEFDGHPLIYSIDMTIVGAWGEGGGTELMEPAKIAQILYAYLDNFKITPLKALLHDPTSLKIVKDSKKKVGFRVDCLGDMGGFHKDEWSHMLDFYPQNIQNFHMADAWKTAPVAFEACWHMNDWFFAGWDIDYIIDESLKWHISSYNSKGTTVPEEWKDSVTRWLLKMGYRFELRKLSYTSDIKTGEPLMIKALFVNAGVAPIYRKYPFVIRLSNQQSSYRFASKADIRSWMPDCFILTEDAFDIKDVPAGEYTLSVGIETGNHSLGNIKLAIEGYREGYYCMGKIMIREV